MPPTTQEILDALAAMQRAPIAPGYCSIAESAAAEIERLQNEVRLWKNRSEAWDNAKVER